MSLEQYTKLLRDTGHRVVITDSGGWSNVSRGMYMNFPIHRPVQPEPAEIRKILGLGGIAVRYTCPLKIGRESYELVCSDKSYGLASLPQKGRNRTRRGLEMCSVRRIAWDELESVGALEVSKDTRLRQGRAVPINHDSFLRKYWSVAHNLDSMEAWGSFVGNKLAAFLIASRIEDRMYIWSLNSDRNLLQANPNNALFYVFTRDAISRKEITAVSTGLESMQSDPGDLERFKMRMGFDRVPIGQRIRLNHIYGFALRDPMLRILQNYLSNGSNNSLQSKIGVLLRWYSEQPSL